MGGYMNQQERRALAIEKYSEVQIAQATAWTMRTFEPFVKYIDWQNPEVGYIFFYAIILKPADMEGIGRSHQIGEYNDRFVRVEDFTFLFIDTILAEKLPFSASHENQRIAAMIDEDIARGSGHAQFLKTFPDWRVECCSACGQPRQKVNYRDYDPKKGRGIKTRRGDTTAVLECEFCENIDDFVPEFHLSVPPPDEPPKRKRLHGKRLKRKRRKR